MRLLATFFAFMGSLLLTSCFDIREEIWIDASGSGRAEMTYVIPSSAFLLGGGEEELRKLIQQLVDSEATLSLEQLTTTEAGSDTRISLKVSTTSVLSLIDIQENETLRNLPEAASGFAGEFDVGLDGLAVKFDRQLDLKDTLGLAALAISSEQRARRKLEYIIHLPEKPYRHNATKTSNDGRTLSWNYSLADALDTPILTSFRARIPVPWWIYLGAAILTALLATALSKAWKRHKDRKAQA